MLPAAHTAELRIVTGSGRNSLQDTIEEVGPERRREREHHEQLRFAVEIVFAHEAAVRRAIVGRGRRFRRRRSFFFRSARTELGAKPCLERSFEQHEGVLQTLAR